MLIVTDKAANKIKSLVDLEGKDIQTDGLKISVAGGGCSGFQYIMEIRPSDEADRVFANGDSKVYIDDKSLMFVSGSVVDYNDGLTNAGFVIQNPAATGTCGCGQSFSM